MKDQSDTSLQDLSKRERQIMDIIFRAGPLSAQEILDQLPDPPGYATVRKLLGILETKGHVIHTKSGRQFIYQAKASKENVRKSSLNHLLTTFFKGSISEAVATFLDQSDPHITEEELDELEQLVQQAKQKKS